MDDTTLSTFADPEGRTARFGRAARAALGGITLLATLATAAPAAADGPPGFFRDSLPEHAIDEMLAGYGAFQGEGAVLDAKTRELIALGVAAQVPCVYCVYAHRRNALKAGASDAELREAVATGAFVRLWSTMLQGGEIDFEAFKAEHDAMREGS